MADNDTRATARLTNLERTLNGEGRQAIAPANSTAPECSDADHVFLFSYLIPAFWNFTDDALTASRPEDVGDLIDQSYTFRQLLWAYLPRCDDALELGLMMRSIAADTVAMLALEITGVPVLRIPYLKKIRGDMQLFFERIADFFSTCGSIDGATTTYYVVAENIANLRSCASTNCSIVTTASRGQRLDVTDDLSSWYEITLPSCETAYIAGFLPEPDAATSLSRSQRPGQYWR